jgi:hypothetical protein
MSLSDLARRPSWKRKTARLMIGDIAKMNFCGCLLGRDDHRGGYYVGACVSLRELKAIMVDIGGEAWTYEPCAEGFTRLCRVYLRLSARLKKTLRVRGYPARIITKLAR